MGIQAIGFLELESGLDDMQIPDSKKKDILQKAGTYAREKVRAETYKRTGMLSRSWRTKFQRVDGNWSIRLYSIANHDIYNEFGSSTNKAHIGFFSNTIDREMKQITDIIIEGVTVK